MDLCPFRIRPLIIDSVHCYFRCRSPIKICVFLVPLSPFANPSSIPHLVNSQSTLSHTRIFSILCPQSAPELFAESRLEIS